MQTFQKGIATIRNRSGIEKNKVKGGGQECSPHTGVVDKD
jgi:hypothetical protein